MKEADAELGKKFVVSWKLRNNTTQIVAYNIKSMAEKVAELLNKNLSNQLFPTEGPAATGKYVVTKEDL
jgi:hypothetical protein